MGWTGSLWHRLRDPVQRRHAAGRIGYGVASHSVPGLRFVAVSRLWPSTLNPAQLTPLQPLHFPSLTPPHRPHTQIQDGQMHGKGALIYPNGERYEGSWCVRCAGAGGAVLSG